MTRSLCIPPAPDRLRAAGATPEAVAMRERFVRSAAEAWRRAGDANTAARLSAAADAIATRFAGRTSHLA